MTPPASRRKEPLCYSVDRVLSDMLDLRPKAGRGAANPKLRNVLKRFGIKAAHAAFGAEGAEGAEMSRNRINAAW